MNTSTIILILAIVVAASIVLIIGSQLRERSRIERARRVTALEDRYNRALRLLTELPGQYLNKELKLLLIQQLELASSGLKSLKAGESANRKAQQAAQLRQAAEAGTDKQAPVKVDTPEKSKHIQELLQVLFKMLEGMHKAGQIDGATAKKNLKYVLFLVHKTHADLHVFLAREHVKQNRIRKAIHEYHLASTEINKSRDNPLAAKAIKSFRTRIHELEEAARENSTEQAAIQYSQTKLDRDWDTFLHDDEWKKKADYDD